MKILDVKDKEKGIEEVEKIEKDLEEKIYLKVEKTIAYKEILEVAAKCYDNWRKNYHEQRY